jgi:diguanylate cyclase (GGDEF)-like protein
VAVFSVNLDRFGLVNDSLGRDVGDRMLVQVAQRIKSVLRPDDTLARFHGDEFVVVCEGVGSPDEAGRIADRIADSMRRPVRDGAVEATMSVSIGIALGRSGDDSAETLLRDADAARSRAKERGKARHEFFDRSSRRARSRSRGSRRTSGRSSVRPAWTRRSSVSRSPRPP